MPAAAVIPAPIAYIKIVAVKKLVVGFLVRRTWPVSVYGIACRCAPSILREIHSYPSLGRLCYPDLLL